MTFDEAQERMYKLIEEEEKLYSVFNAYSKALDNITSLKRELLHEHNTLNFRRPKPAKYTNQDEQQCLF